MANQYSKVKYSLYFKGMSLAESDDEHSSIISSSDVNGKNFSRKHKNFTDTKVYFDSPRRLKLLDEDGDVVSDPLTSIHQASRVGNFEQLKLLLDNLSPEACQLKVNKLDENKRGPLHYAARYNHVCVTQLLIEKGADINILGEDGLTPLHFAARYGYSRGSRYLPKQCSIDSPSTACRTVICMLIERGAEVNFQDTYGMTPLHYAAMRGNAIATSQLLLSNKINTEIFDKQEMTSLHCAANYNSPEVVELLLKADANPEASDENVSTPLHLAATTGNREIVLLLLEAVEKNGGVDKLTKYIDEKNMCGNTALHLAVTKGHLDVVEVLLDKGADPTIILDNYSQPLHLAAVSGNVEVVKLLLQHGAEVNCVNSFGETPLHKAAEFNATDVIDFLLKNGADIEAYDCAHFTPLLNAVDAGHVEAVEEILKAGANVDVVDNMDRTVVYLAAQKNHPEVLKILLNYGDVNVLANRCDHYDNSPLHVAALRGYTNIIEVLLNNCAEIEKKNEHEQTPLHLASKNGHESVAQLLINHCKSIVSAEDENANTPLHLASLSGHYQVVSVLLTSGSNCRARNCYLWTALDCAASRGWKRCCKILLNAGCPVDAVDKSNTTPLHLAAREGHRGVVKLLLKCGAQIAQCDKTGKNCLDLAIDKGHEEVAMEILSDANWEAVLRNESDKNRFCVHQTPLRRLIRYMPDVTEYIFNRCVTRNEFADDHPKLEVTYNYEFLDDMFACYRPHLYEDLDRTGDSSLSGTSIFTGSNIYDDDGHVKKKVLPYTDDKEVLKSNHPLMLMVSYKREHLLNHPLCESLLNHKWKNYGRYVYYSNLLVFILFLTSLTSYVVTAVPPCPLQLGEEDSKCCAERNFTCQPYIGKCDVDIELTFPRLCRTFIYVLAVIHLLKEVYQIHQNGRKYLNIENILEWSCYLSALIFVADLNDCSARTGIRQVWQWELGSFSIFSAWMVLLMFISKFPFLGIYVIMFIQILSTFVNFSFVFFLFVVAFALAFFTVLQNQDPFESPGEAIVKTSVMMIGEIEFDSIFNDPDNKVYFKGPAYILFIFFLLLMAVITMNLLIGLAVDDIKGVQEKAEIKRLAMKVELVLTVERNLPIVALRKCISRRRTISPNAWQTYPWYWKLFRIHHTLSTRLDKSPLEELEEQQSKVSKQLKHMKETINMMQKDVKNIHTILENQRSTLNKGSF